MVVAEVPTRDSMDTRTRTTRGSHNFMTPVFVCMSATIIVVAVAHDPLAEHAGVWRWCLVLLFVPLVAWALLALEDAKRIPDAGPPCVGLASEDAGPPRTYRMSSLLYCAGLLGWQLLAVLHRTTSSAEQLRGSTALLRASSRYLWDLVTESSGGGISTFIPPGLHLAFHTTRHGPRGVGPRGWRRAAALAELRVRP